MDIARPYKLQFFSTILQELMNTYLFPDNALDNSQENMTSFYKFVHVHERLPLTQSFSGCLIAYEWNKPQKDSYKDSNFICFLDIQIMKVEMRSINSYFKAWSRLED